MARNHEAGGFVNSALNQVTLLGSYRFADVVVDVDRLCSRRCLDHTHHCARLSQTVRHTTPFFRKFFLADISPFYGVTQTPVLDFW